MGKRLLTLSHEKDAKRGIATAIKWCFVFVFFNASTFVYLSSSISVSMSYFLFFFLQGRTQLQQMREIAAVFQLCEALMAGGEQVVSFAHMLSFLQPAIAFLNQVMLV